jgi:hypothetical protein
MTGGNQTPLVYLLLTKLPGNTQQIIESGGARASLGLPLMHLFTPSGTICPRKVQTC